LKSLASTAAKAIRGGGPKILGMLLLPIPLSILALKVVFFGVLLPELK